MNAKHPSQSWQKAPLLTSCPNLHLGSHLWFLIFSFISPPNTKQVSQQVLLLQDGEPLPGPGRELLSNTQNELSKETHMQIKQEILLGRGTWVESRKVRESRRTALPCELQSWVFMVMELVSGLSLASHSDSGSFLVAHVLLSQDGFQWGWFWKVVGHVAPFDLSRILLVGSGLLVLCSLPGLPVIK